MKSIRLWLCVTLVLPLFPLGTAPIGCRGCSRKRHLRQELIQLQDKSYSQLLRYKVEASLASLRMC
jgi:hypothetical protein